MIQLCQQIILVQIIMITDDKARDEKLKPVFTETQQKCQHYHGNLINMNILQAKIHYLLVKFK